MYYIGVGIVAAVTLELWRWAAADQFDVVVWPDGSWRYVGDFIPEDGSDDCRVICVRVPRDIRDIAEYIEKVVATRG